MEVGNFDKTSERLEYCQAQVQSPKVQIPVKGLGVTLKSHGQRDQDHVVVQHVQGEGYQPPKTSRSWSSQVPKVFRMTLPTHPG